MHVQRAYQCTKAHGNTQKDFHIKLGVEFILPPKLTKIYSKMPNQPCCISEKDARLTERTPRKKTQEQNKLCEKGLVIKQYIHVIQIE